jgi:hypothetical protein
MLIGQIVPTAEIDLPGSLRFDQGDTRCIVTDGWAEYYGYHVRDDGFSEVVAVGYERGWVVTATQMRAGPAVDPDLVAEPVAETRKPTAWAFRTKVPPLDIDLGDLVDDGAFEREEEIVPAYAHGM